MPMVEGVHVMSLRELILARVIVNVLWSLVWIELRAGYAAGWIVELMKVTGLR